MPTRRPSSSSAGAIYLDRESRINELRQMAQRAATKMPEIRRVILFGSLTSGIPTPRSDADLLIEVENSACADPRDRAASVWKALAPVKFPIDLHVYTTKELTDSTVACSGLVTAALRDGLDLLV